MLRANAATVSSTECCFTKTVDMDITTASRDTITLEPVFFTVGQLATAAAHIKLPTTCILGSILNGGSMEYMSPTSLEQKLSLGNAAGLRS